MCTCSGVGPAKTATLRNAANRSVRLRAPTDMQKAAKSCAVAVGEDVGSRLPAH